MDDRPGSEPAVSHWRIPSDGASPWSAVRIWILAGLATLWGFGFVVGALTSYGDCFSAACAALARDEAARGWTIYAILGSNTLAAGLTLVVRRRPVAFAVVATSGLTTLLTGASFMATWIVAGGLPAFMPPLFSLFAPGAIVLLAAGVVAVRRAPPATAKVGRPIGR
jgi:hypothetical protein